MKIRYTPPRKASSAQQGPITPGEQRVIDNLMLGNSNRDIGLCLGISEETVKRHLYNVFSKMGVENRGACILAEVERRERLKCLASAAAPDKKLTPPSTSLQQRQPLA